MDILKIASGTDKTMERQTKEIAMVSNFNNQMFLSMFKIDNSCMWPLTNMATTLKDQIILNQPSFAARTTLS